MKKRFKEPKNRLASEEVFGLPDVISKCAMESQQTDKEHTLFVFVLRKNTMGSF